MVFSELAAATMIAVCGLKNSYRIILKGERLVRGRIRRPRTVLEGYDSFPRFFIRRVFRAGLVIAMRWEGRAKNAAQIAADARMRARVASNAVATRVERVRTRAEDVRQTAKEGAQRVRSSAAGVRKRAEDVRTKAQDQAVMIRDRAAEVRQKAEDVKDAAVAVKNRAVAAKDRAVAAKDRVVEISKQVKQRVRSRAGTGEESRKMSTTTKAIPGKQVRSGKRMFHTSGLAGTDDSLDRFKMVHDRLAHY